MTAANAELLAALRQGTASAHEALEGQLALVERAAGDPAWYGELLVRFSGWYRPVEQALGGWWEAFPDLVPDWPDRAKAGWLDDDLARLGFGGCIPTCPAVPATLGRAEGLGWAYVTEGATLGGAVVCRALPELPVRFFSSYGRERARRWRTFCHDAGRAEVAHEVTVEAARAAFSSLTAWTKPLVADW